MLHDDLMNGDFDDYSPSPSTRASPAPFSRIKYSRYVYMSVKNSHLDNQIPWNNKIIKINVNSSYIERV